MGNVIPQQLLKGQIMADKTIYVVTSGVYSDYRILAVFANEIAAQTFIKGRERPKDCRIEKYPLNTEVCLNTYYVLFYPDRDNDPWFVCEIPYQNLLGSVPLPSGMAFS